MGKPNNPDLDKAGQGYWDSVWNGASLPPAWDISGKSLRNYVERAFFDYMAEAFEKNGLSCGNLSLIEIGGARSPALPTLAKRLGFKVTCLDYSEIGCEQSRLMFERECVDGDVYCADIFEPPSCLLGVFDVVVSFGVIEHFEDTAKIVSAMVKLLKPGGLIVTSIPNMHGTVGGAQKLLNRAIYDIHVALTPEEVRNAHERAGLDVIECDYFICANYGVVNIGDANPENMGWFLKKTVRALLARGSMAAWKLESIVGALRATRTFSPYVNCVARRRV